MVGLQTAHILQLPTIMSSRAAFARDLSSDESVYAAMGSDIPVDA
jgi:hypothetical protein